LVGAAEPPPRHGDGLDERPAGDPLPRASLPARVPGPARLAPRAGAPPWAPRPDSGPARPSAPGVLAGGLGPVGLRPALLPLRGRARAAGPRRRVRAAARHAVGAATRDRRFGDRERAREPPRVLGTRALVGRLVRVGGSTPRLHGGEPGDRGRRARGLRGALLPRGHPVRGPDPTWLARARRPDRAALERALRSGLPPGGSRRDPRRRNPLRPRARGRLPEDRHPRRRPLPLSPAVRRRALT